MRPQVWTAAWLFAKPKDRRPELWSRTGNRHDRREQHKRTVSLMDSLGFVLRGKKTCNWTLNYTHKVVSSIRKYQVLDLHCSFCLAILIYRQPFRIIAQLIFCVFENNNIVIKCLHSCYFHTQMLFTARKKLFDWVVTWALFQQMQ